MVHGCQFIRRCLGAVPVCPPAPNIRCSDHDPKVACSIVRAPLARARDTCPRPSRCCTRDVSVTICYVRKPKLELSFSQPAVGISNILPLGHVSLRGGVTWRCEYGNSNPGKFMQCTGSRRHEPRVSAEVYTRRQQSVWNSPLSCPPTMKTNLMVRPRRAHWLHQARHLPR